MLGQDQQHLVLQPDRGIDRVEDFGADRQVVRCKPAAHTFVLQVGMNASGKVLISGRVADEPGIVLNGLTQKRRQIINQLVRQADSAKKSKWQPAGFLKGFKIDRTWPQMMARVQSDYAGEISFAENVPNNSASVRLVPAKSAQLKFALLSAAPVRSASFKTEAIKFASCKEA